MQHVVLNRATVRVADRTDVSGRVTAALAIFGSLGYDRRAGQPLLRLLALLLALAVSTPVLLADDRDHDHDQRDHGRSVDPIVGSWIVHVTLDTLDPNPDHVPLPFKAVDNVANLGADGNTADFSPPSTTLYGPWVKVGDRIYRQKIVTVNADRTITTAFTGPLVLSPDGNQISGPMHTFVTDPNDGHIIVQWSGPLVFDRIKFSLAP